ncbi:hypothetical protein [Neotamlana laminarinivorans]|uniref:Uncharacterized protein n=1 Tax=Neotamlana laminarinivorans TaxID=2883124 RepID=A0A9X1L2Z6_9FLAO|nr:hypothetical protein [Tamlana laminarinivorans]MCB4800310.1 hypothetical protein [Tamlana laminarinivorans]
MENLIEKSAEQIKDRIEFWFFKYFNKSKTDFTGNEIFTLFECLSKELQTDIKKRLDLNRNEIPVLVLKISESEFIINTTKKFVRIDSKSTEIINYTEFEWHNGYKSFVVDKEKKIITKHNGYFAEFGLTKTNGKTIYWKIPTGVPGYGFWNVTKKCELIGRKYKIAE